MGGGKRERDADNDVLEVDVDDDAQLGQRTTHPGHLQHRLHTLQPKATEAILALPA